MKEKCAQSKTNLAKLAMLHSQISEEFAMTAEDKEAQQREQAGLVAKREDMDLLLYEQTKNIFGQEFSVFIALDNNPGDCSLAQEYEKLKMTSFIQDVVK